MKVIQIRQSIAHFDQCKPVISKMKFKIKSTGPFLSLLRFEVNEAKFLNSSSFYDFHYRIFVVFVFDKISKGHYRERAEGNTFNDYIFEINGFH